MDKNEWRPYGTTIGTLEGMAWLFGVIAMASIVRLLTYAGARAHVETELFVWVLIGTVAAAFSACCAAIAGVKAAEQRLLAALGNATPPSPRVSR